MEPAISANPKPDQSKIPRKRQKLTPKEQLIVRYHDPTKTKYANLKALEDKGLMNMQSGYKRFKVSEYLNEKIDLLNTHWEEFLVREAMPIASKNVIRKLKGKDGDTFPATKLVIDTYYKRNDQPPVQINTYIEQIQQMFGGGVPAIKARPKDQLIDLCPSGIDPVGSGTHER